MKYALTRWALYTLAALTIAAFQDAHAAKMWVSWVASTENIDGSPLTDLKGYRVEWGSCNPDGTFGVFQAGVSVGPAVTRTVIYPTNLSPVCARVYAINAQNRYSSSSNVGQGAPPPLLSQPTH